MGNSNMTDILGDKVNINQVIAKKQLAGDSVLRVRTQEVLSYKDNGLSVEEARKRMLEAGQAPKGIAKEAQKNRAVGVVVPKPAAESVVAPEPAAPAADAPAVVVPVVPASEPVATVEVKPAPAERGSGGSVPSADAVDTRAEHLENDRFIVDIKQDRGEWAAVITFKNGAGTEKFTARTKNELMMKLAEGKGNATLRVRAAVRREKLGTAQYDSTYSLPDGVTLDEFNALSEGAKRAFIQNLEVAAGNLFLHRNPDYLPTEKNADTLWSFLTSRNLPITYRNMCLAYEDLSEDGLLETKPQPQAAQTPISVPVAPVPAPAPKAEDSAPVAVPMPATPVVVPTPAPAAVVVRTRGTSGLQPGQSSVTNAELEERPAAPTEPSAAELRAKAPINKPLRGSALEAEYKQLMAERSRNRQRT